MADSHDEEVIALWLHGRSPHTQRAYRADAGRFLTFAGKPIAAATLGDVQSFMDSLDI
jgi:integrase/recombinase XerD